MRFIVLFLSAMWVVSCAAHDEHYYVQHPVLLQEALKTCPQKQPTTLTCEQLTSLALRLNKLAFELRINPQAFGNKILGLQEQLFNQQNQLKKQPNQPELLNLITSNTQQLDDRLSVVKWLESPQS